MLTAVETDYLHHLQRNVRISKCDRIPNVVKMVNGYLQKKIRTKFGQIFKMLEDYWPKFIWSKTKFLNIQICTAYVLAISEHTHCLSDEVVPQTVQTPIAAGIKSIRQSKHAWEYIIENRRKLFHLKNNFF